MRYHQNVASVTIVQRARGVYLCNHREDKDGTEEWEATSSLAEAKRWCAAQLGVARPKWEETRRGGYWPTWSAETVFDGDPIYEDED